MASPVYKEVVKSRTGMDVPVFADGKIAHSKYNPLREAERLARTISPAGFFVVSGAGGGYFIAELRRTFPASPVVAAECSAQDIAFLSQCPYVKMLMRDPLVTIVPLDEVTEAIKSHYIPAWHGTLGIIEWAPWAHSNSGLLTQFHAQVQRARELLAADVSTQARFGKLWQRNILLNVMALNNLDPIASPVVKHTGGVESKIMALVAAAGPSLDQCAESIRLERNRLFVIATDTAYTALTRQGIQSDAVVSIDGQQVSHVHFMTSPPAPPLFIMDLAADPSAVRHAAASGGRICFVRTGHPLSQLLAPQLFAVDAGGGTVTIAACDYARQMGFDRIAAAGADFAYIAGRPYARGTYLDTLYAMNATRIQNTETAFCTLMMRTQLTHLSHGIVTTPLLESYRSSFEAWMAKHGYQKDGGGVKQWDEYQMHSPKMSSQYTHRENRLDTFLPIAQHNARGQKHPMILIDTRSAALTKWLHDCENAFCDLSSSSALPYPPPALIPLLPCAAFHMARNQSLDLRNALALAISDAKIIIR